MEAQQVRDDKVFENIDYSEKQLSHFEFNNCEFIGCNFQKANLAHNEFIDCRFRSCNFSLVSLTDTGIKNVSYMDCKVMGVDFSKCNSFLFAASFQNCTLDYCSFAKKKMKKSIFTDCSLKQVDFEEADLTASVFKKCDLLNAHFSRSILEKADLGTAINYIIDPEANRIKKARFSFPAAAGLLNKYDIEID